MKNRTADIATGLLFLFYGVLYIFYITPNFVTNPLKDTSADEMDWTLRPEALPYLNIGVFLLFSVILILQAVRSKSDTLLNLELGSLGKVGFVIAWSFLYSSLLPIFGFRLLSPIFLAVLILTFGVRDWRYAAGISIVMPILMEFFFFQTFQIILPEGRLWDS